MHKQRHLRVSAAQLNMLRHSTACHGTAQGSRALLERYA
jgi:hypothetical protein